MMKKVFWIFLIGIVFFSEITNVYASILMIENVSNQFNQSMNGTETSITSKVNTTGKTLDIYSENEKVFSFTYGDNYIEYNNRNAVLTEENISESISTTFWVYSIIETVFELSGYENKALSEDVTYTDTYDTYGFQMETGSYSFSGSEENGSWSMSGDFIKYFKISLDTEKIKALIAKYGVDVDDLDLTNLVPTIEAKDITDNSISIYPKVNIDIDDSDYIIYCNIYRSDSENGTYEKISNGSVNCLGGVGIVDEGLKSNTTYYYKAIVVGGLNYSEPLAATTNNSNGDTIENPKTGFAFPIITIAIVLIGGTAVILYTKNKNFFKKL